MRTDAGKNKRVGIIFEGIHYKRLKDIKRAVKRMIGEEITYTEAARKAVAEYKKVCCGNNNA